MPGETREPTAHAWPLVIIFVATSIGALVGIATLFNLGRPRTLIVLILLGIAVLSAILLLWPRLWSWTRQAELVAVQNSLNQLRAAVDQLRQTQITPAIGTLYQATAHLNQVAAQLRQLMPPPNNNPPPPPNINPPPAPNNNAPVNANQ